MPEICWNLAKRAAIIANQGGTAEIVSVLDKIVEDGFFYVLLGRKIYGRNDYGLSIAKRSETNTR